MSELWNFSRWLIQGPTSTSPRKPATATVIRSLENETDVFFLSLNLWSPCTPLWHPRYPLGVPVPLVENLGPRLYGHGWYVYELYTHNWYVHVYYVQPINVNLSPKRQRLQSHNITSKNGRCQYEHMKATNGLLITDYRNSLHKIPNIKLWQYDTRDKLCTGTNFTSIHIGTQHATVPW